uniref:Uncharacterized protein n=2 Tax=gambiae species complex TaxID=44542 RepID=A0A182I3H6_ANOAR
GFGYKRVDCLLQKSPFYCACIQSSPSTQPSNKMKFLILLALFGAAFGQNLRAEVDQLLPFLNMDEVRTIYERYVQTDAQVGEIWSFLQSEETDAAWRVLIGTPELQEISAWTEVRGVSIRDYLNGIAAMLGLTPITRSVNARSPASRSWNAMMDEIRAATNLEGAEALARTFIADPTSEFGELYRMTQARRAGFTRVIEHPDVTRFSAQLRAFGVDVDQIITRFRNFFGWN